MSETLFEYRQIGNSVKVTAVDPRTGIEVSIVANANLTRYSMQQAAQRKLKRAIQNKTQNK